MLNTQGVESPPAGGVKVRYSHFDSENFRPIIGHNLETVQDRW